MSVIIAHTEEISCPIRLLDTGRHQPCFETCTSEIQIHVGVEKPPKRARAVFSADSSTHLDTSWEGVA